MLSRYFLILLIATGFVAPALAFAQDAEKAADAPAAEAAPTAEAAPAIQAEDPKAEQPEPPKVEAPKMPEPAKPTPPAPMPVAAPMKMEPPKAPEMPKMEPPKVDPELAASTERWVNLSDQQRLDILEDWKKLPEENRVPFMLYRDEATKKVKPEAKAEPVDAKDTKDGQAEVAPAPDISVPPAAPPAEEPAKEEGTVSKLMDKIF